MVRILFCALLLFFSIGCNKNDSDSEQRIQQLENELKSLKNNEGENSTNNIEHEKVIHQAYGILVEGSKHPLITFRGTGVRKVAFSICIASQTYASPDIVGEATLNLQTGLWEGVGYHGNLENSGHSNLKAGFFQFESIDKGEKLKVHSNLEGNFGGGFRGIPCSGEPCEVNRL